MMATAVTAGNGLSPNDVVAVPRQFTSFIINLRLVDVISMMPKMVTLALQCNGTRK